MGSYVDNYLGEWCNDRGNRLLVHKVSDTFCLVDFLSGFNGQPIARPWCDGQPSVDMEGHYHPGWGPELVVDLWEGNRFSLLLDYDLGSCPEGSLPETVGVALSRNEEDDFLDQYYGLLGPLGRYRRPG